MTSWHFKRQDCLTPGTIREKDYTFFRRGKPEDERREHGVGFAVKTFSLALPRNQKAPERLLLLKLQTALGPVHIISVYAPTLSYSSDAKDSFYEELGTMIKNVPEQEKLILMGDFNARVGSDQQSWPSCLGPHGVGNMNENGQRLLETCAYNQLCITNTYFCTKPHHKVSWMHPRSKHWHQLDLILTRRSNLRLIQHTRSYHSADCDSDHYLVLCKIKLCPEKIHRLKKNGNPKLNIHATTFPDRVKEYNTELENQLSQHTTGNATETWKQLGKTIYDTALTTFGKKIKCSLDWFESFRIRMLPVIEEKRHALTNYKQTPSNKNHQRLKTARATAQRVARQCANDIWEITCNTIQECADAGDIKGVYSGIKLAIGPAQIKTAPLKTSSGDVIKDKAGQMNRWVEHYSELYSRETTVTEEALSQIERLPTVEELDTIPTQEELNKAFSALSNGKAPGNDGIPAEILKCTKDTLLPHLHKLLCLCWEEKAVPQAMRDANIITLYKNKGDRSDCNNYRGISLLSIVGKLFARVVLKQLKQQKRQKCLTLLSVHQHSLRYSGPSVIT